MDTSGARHIVVIIVVLTWSVLSSSFAADAAEPAPALRRIRVLPRCSDTLVDDAAAMSATVRALVARIERSDLIVYVRCVGLKHHALAGRLLFVTAVHGQRYLMIEVQSPELWQTQAATVAHELQHAAEIADAPWVRSRLEMAQFYRLTGVVVGTMPLTFDTEAARQTEARVQRELGARRDAAAIVARRR